MSLTILTGSRVWTALGWTMLHFIWVGVVVGLMAAVGRRLVKPSSPEWRYGLALVCLAALAGSPILIFIRVFEPSVPARVVPVGSVRTGHAAIDRSTSSWESPKPARLESQRLTILRPAVGQSGWKLDSVVRYLPWFWLCGSLSTLLALATGLIGVEQLRRSSRVLESGEIPGRVRALADSLGIALRVSIGVCERLAVPVLMGIVRPMILVPPAALCGWSVDELEMVLLHELAHVRRWDNLANLVQRVVESLLFFHPAVWWLSAWVRLERELCCDRLVVDRVGQPHAYAEMLVSLSGSSHRGGGVMLAMADRQVSTRVRLLLNAKERSMRLTMPEGLGVLGAVIVGASLMLGSQAAQRQPAGQSEESVRQALRKAADDVGALPQKGPERGLEMETLSFIAQAQLKIGDRAAALATMQRAYDSIGRLDPKQTKAERLHASNVELLGALCRLAKQQREAESLPAARTTLDRLTELVDSLESTPIVEEIHKMGKAPEGTKEEITDAIRAELLWIIADERLALGDRDEARAIYRRAGAGIRSQKGETKAIFLSAIGSGLHKAGDPSGGRKMIEQGLLAAGKLPDGDARERAMPHVASAMAETGDLDGALKLVGALGKTARQTAMRKIIETLTEDDGRRGWLVTGGIKIMIGADSLRMKDKNSALTTLPRIAEAVRSLDDPLTQVRTLSTIAHLQAKASDFGSALQTVESIPDITRQQFSGPSDGFYDAIKPATLAKVGRLQFEAVNRGGAESSFSRATTLSRAIKSADQRIVAQIVIIDELFQCGFQEQARALLREALPFASQQPEPLRSRSLAMFSKSQVKAGDVVEAHQTIDAIRAYPCLEKLSALNTLARWYGKQGDLAAEQTYYREALRCVEIKEPADAQPKQPIRNLGPIAAHTFVDFELELPPGLVEHEKQMVAMFVHADLGDINQALKVGRSIPGGSRSVALSNLAGAQARRGDVAGAFKLAASFETAQERLTAYELVACAIRDGDERD
jgi:beta-lactamase regulating signal transducer with metallopeptidase domain/tetratricopeptide (TPR) repeat protein